MNKKSILATLVSLALLTGAAGCAAKTTPAPAPAPQQSTQQAAPPAKPVDSAKMSSDITKLIDEKFPGEWKVSGSKLSKGNYTENDNYKIADAVGAAYPGSMVSIFVGQTRVSTTVGNTSTGKRALDYPVPAAISEVMKNGKVISGTSTGMGTGMGSYQKVYVPIKSGNTTIAVLSISVM
jgi:hypothetical protein